MKNKLVEHHVKYKEIHGVDETVWITPSEHRKLHNKLRREGKCEILPNELNKISRAANKRTSKNKKYNKLYKLTKQYENNKNLYKLTKQYKNSRKQYKKKAIERFSTYDTIAPNILLSEQIIHNKNTGTILVISNFIGNHGTKIITKEI